MSRTLHLLVLSLLVSLAYSTNAQEVPAKVSRNGKLKIFVLAGQSNMVGFGQVKPRGDNKQGTMVGYVEANPDAYGRLVNAAGEPIVRDDVYVVNLSGGKQKQGGWLDTNFGAMEGHIGPEYGFGWAVGDHFEDPVLIIKCSWGGKSLSHDFLPPSAGDYPEPQKEKDTGWYYAQTIKQVKTVTDDLKAYFPDYDGNGYEIVGFGWHQGWNDRINMDAVNAYESNLVHLIKDLRRDLGVEKMPFVIANTGMGGWDIPENASYKQRVEKLMVDQLAVADDEKYPDFSDNVAGVETRDFQRSEEQSPSKQGFHWNRNWETVYLIGYAMWEEMIGLRNYGK